MPENIGLKGSKLVEGGYTTGIPGEDVERNSISEHYGGCEVGNHGGCEVENQDAQKHRQ